MICPLRATPHWASECRKDCQWWDNSINNCIIHRLAYMGFSQEEIDAEIEKVLLEQTDLM